MKGISLPVNTIVVITIVVLVLVTIMFFFTSSSATGLTRSEATKIFFESCSQLECSTAGDICLEIFVTKHETNFFVDFYKACKVLYGGDKYKPLLCFNACGGCADITKEQYEYMLRGQDTNGDGSGDEVLCLQLGTIGKEERSCQKQRCSSVP